MRMFSLKSKRVIKMLYTHKELLKTYKSNYQIEKAVREQKVFKIEKGIYSDKKMFII